MQADLHILSGGFTSPSRQGVAHGVSLLRLDGGGAHVVAELPMTNPSWLVRHPTLRSVVWAGHSDDGNVSAFTWTTDALLPLATRSTGGRNVAHVACAPDGRTLLAACFGSGEVVALPLREDGGIEEVRSRLAFGEGSEPHQVDVAPDGRRVVVPDRGQDALRVLAFDAANHALTVEGRVALPRGSGPRHLAWHPSLPRAYLANEHASSVTVLSAALEPLQTLPALPAGAGASASAGIAVSPDGRRLYVSNRGHDSVARFDIGADGGLAARGWIEGVGASPRFIRCDAAGLWIASHGSHEIRRRAPGRPESDPPDLRFDSPSPACVLPLFP